MKITWILTMASLLVGMTVFANDEKETENIPYATKEIIRQMHKDIDFIKISSVKKLDAEVIKAMQNGKLEDANIIKNEINLIKSTLTPEKNEVAVIRFPDGTITDTMKTGVSLFTNRGYVAEGVAEKLKGLIFNKSSGNEFSSIAFTVVTPGVIYLAVCQDGADVKAIGKAGWTMRKNLGFNYSDKNKSKVLVFSKTINNSAEIKNFGGFLGSVIIANTK